MSVGKISIQLVLLEKKLHGFQLNMHVKIFFREQMKNDLLKRANSHLACLMFNPYLKINVTMGINRSVFLNFFIKTFINWGTVKLEG